MAADGAGRAQHVGSVFNLGAGEPSAQIYRAFPYQTGGIEMDVFHAGANLTGRMVQNGFQMVLCGLQNVESGGTDIAGLFPLHHTPVGLSGPAVNN